MKKLTPKERESFIGETFSGVDKDRYIMFYDCYHLTVEAEEFLAQQIEEAVAARDREWRDSVETAWMKFGDTVPFTVPHQPDFEHVPYELAGWNEALYDYVDSAVEAERKECAMEASSFTVKAGRSIHPDIPWDDMSETVKLTAHTTAQQIAAAILNRGEKDG